jgi:uncharacterized protein
MTATRTILDWTAGDAGIAYQRCDTCRARWYFRRDFCPRCGAAAPALLQAAGQGTVHALTRVHRAPTEALRPHAPYTIVLVDTDEGFRVMAHGDAALAIGDRVQAKFIEFGGSLVPCFERL